MGFGSRREQYTLAVSTVLDERKRQLLALLLAEEGIDPLRTPILPLPRDAQGVRRGPLSFAQERLWLIDQIEPGNIAYNVPSALRLRGRLAPGLLARTLGEIVRRHETLRTTYAAGEGGPVQVVAPPSPLALPGIDLGSLPAAAREAEARRLALAEVDRPFDLREGPLLRLQLLRLGEEEHLLLATLHHIATDGWSNGIFVRELTALYAAFSQGLPSPLPELPVQYADFAAWQRRVFQGEVLEKVLGYWRRQLAGSPPVLALPTDRPRPAVQGLAGGSVLAELPAGLAAVVKELCRRSGATLFMGITAAFQALLARLTGQSDLSVGTPVANRHRSEIEGLIGYFGNTLVLRGDLGGDPTFRDLLARVREVAIGAFAHQELPFSKLVEEIKPERSLSHTPLFQVMCAVEVPGPPLVIPGLAVLPFPEQGDAALFDLHLTVVDTGSQEGQGGLLAGLAYRAELFDPPTAGRILGQLAVLLAGAVEDPGRRLSELPILSAPERQALFAEWNDTAAPSVEAPLESRLAARAALVPDSPAAAWEGGALSYGELTARAGRLARRLRRLGAGPGARVAIRLERSPELAVAVLAVLRSGAACVPLDPRYPAERLRFMRDDSGASLLVTQESLAVTGSLSVPAAGDDLAYILYTSGSTGRPKGVGMPRSALANLLDWQERVLPGPARTLQFASLSFDVSFQEIVSTWLAGGTLVLVSEETRRDPQALLALLAAQEVERLFLPAVALRQLADAADIADIAAAGDLQEAALRDVVTAGEALQVTGPLAAWLAGRRLHNHYGPTETHVATAWTLAGDPRVWPLLPPIGRPVAKTRVHLLDPDLNLAPIGVVGEIAIGGAGLARGYVGRPEATAERFVPDPWGDGERLYRTGDLARRRVDGAIEYLGRRDAQVKIRGVRVEPGEVEAALESHSGVRQAVVAALPEPGAEGALRLIAWYLPAADVSLTPGELRDFLRQRLPEAFIPSQFAGVESFPLTPSGKIDRRALTVPALSGGSGAEFVPPRNEVEALVAGIWAGLLGLERVGVRDSFFDLGGHSLLATQVMSRLRVGLGVELPLRALFEGPTVEALARSVERALRERTGPAAPPLLARHQPEAPLSFAQQRLWFLHQLEPGSPAYNMYQALRLTGPLDEPALGRALVELVRRQEALRGRFVLRGTRAVQVVSPVPAAVLAVVDLAGLPAPRGEAAGEALARAEGLAPFDLERGPLLRVRLLRLAPDRRLLLVSMHHIVSDAWSMEVFVRELAALYERSPLPELHLQYADYAAWQREWLQGEVLAAELAWWRERLAGAPGLLALPLDRSRPPVHTFAGARRFRRLPPELGEALARLGRSLDATPFMVLLAFWKVLLLRHTGEEDLVVGSPVANRTRRETEGLIGFFVNTLALRTDLSGNPGFAEVARRVRETALGAYTHQDLPFEKLVEELQPARSLRHTPLFQVMLVAETTPASASPSSGLHALEMEVLAVDNGTAKLDLTLVVQEGPDGVELGFGYNTDLFFATTIERLLDHGVALLAAVVSDPARPVGDLPLLAAAERHQLYAEWNDTAQAGCPEIRLHELFEIQARERPDAPAVLAGSAVLTYGELYGRARRLAGHLREQGIGPESRVGIQLPRSPEAVVAILAVLKAGGAYLPLDPSHPPERIAFQVRDAGAAPLLASPLIQAGRNGDPTFTSLRQSPDSLAFVIYTSGSTGEPSGVLMSHRGAVNIVAQSRRRLNVGPGNRMLQITPLGFDVSVGEIFVPLASGAAVCIVGDEERQSPALLAERLAHLGIDRAFVTPAYFAALPAEALPGLVASVGGEAFPRELAERWGHGRRLFNNYGPTEAAVYATSSPVDPEESDEPTIGRPVDGVSAHLLDARLQPVPIGVAGEICLGGAALARGYLNQPEKTAERFVPHPSASPGERLYRTGDLARLLPNGEIELLGRIDAQLKVRGYRIEPGEIEAALLRHPAVRQAAVVVRGEGAAERHLAAYVSAPEAPPEPIELRRFLASALPEHMVPPVVVVLPALPLTANGKVDRRALPDLDRAAAGERAQPSTPMERFLAALCQEVLGWKEIGVDDDFFALGGTSIQAAVLIHLLEERFGEYVYV
ncbi:MAG: hypothetical protein QOJ16_2613, partial [Acidobacteriota bacterium]|nr:hypothetical protein [Acidobacteriota bacterium]